MAVRVKNIRIGQKNLNRYIIADGRIVSNRSPYEICAEILESRGYDRSGMKAKTFCQQYAHVILGVAKAEKSKETFAHRKTFGKAKPKFDSDVMSDAFLSSYEWRKIRMIALKKYGAKCQCCGATPETGATMNVDHIKPRRIFPELALDIDNLQILCHECNHGKGNWDMTDWRSDSPVSI